MRKQMKTLLNKRKGITLIALIITIIVLLIISGVVINKTIGNDGIISKAQQVADKFEYESAKEILEVKLLEIHMDCIENNKEYNLKTIKEKLGASIEEEIEIIFCYGTNAIIKPTVDTYNHLDGILVIVVNYPKYKFLLGKINDENFGITKLAITNDIPSNDEFIDINEFEERYKIAHTNPKGNNKELTIEEKQNIIIEQIEDDILKEISETLGVPKNESSIEDISETLTQAEIETILEKHGKIIYDDDYNIIGLEIFETGTTIPISRIYSTDTYKEEISNVSQGKVYYFIKPVNVEEEIEKQQEFVIQKTGEYLIECWGAQGGDNGGYGAYTGGTIRLKKGDIIYVCVGEQGKSSTDEEGGYNGGGYSQSPSMPAGGGATDIRLIRGETVDDEESLASRIMVAAGGSGAYLIQGLPGGALTSKMDETIFTGTKATQISPATNAFFGKAAITNGYSGAGGGYYGGGYCTFIGDKEGDGIYIGSENQYISFPTDDTYTIKYGKNSSWAVGEFKGGVSLSNGVFGDPINGVVKEGRLLSGTLYLSTGGSSYISGHEGCIAIKSKNDTSPKVAEYSQISDSVHYTGKYFKNTYMCAGDETAENGEGGNYGDGKARITFLQ